MPSSYTACMSHPCTLRQHSRAPAAAQTERGRPPWRTRTAMSLPKLGRLCHRLFLVAVVLAQPGTSSTALLGGVPSRDALMLPARSSPHYKRLRFAVSNQRLNVSKRTFRISDNADVASSSWDPSSIRNNTNSHYTTAILSLTTTVQ